MTKQIFMEQVASRLGEFYPPDNYSIHCETITKNNDTRLHGIMIQKKGEPFTPAIYLDDYYKDYLAKKITLPEVVGQLCVILQSVEEHAEKYRTFSIKYEKCRDKIVYRLISRGRNETILADSPNLPFLDLAILFYVVCDISEKGLESMRVSRALMEQWNLNVGQLMKLAMDNTPRLFPLQIESMDHVLSEYLGMPKKALFHEKEEESEEIRWDIPMLIVSNDRGVNGASVMLYKDVIADLADRFESNLHILPSSIHELIVLPEWKSETREDLSQIVQDINRSHVRPDEVLSDHAYFYDREKKCFQY